MRPITKYYIKNFLLSSVFYTVGMFLLDSLLGFEIGMWSYLFAGVTFGLVMTFMAVVNIENEFQKLGIEDITEEHLKLVQNRSMISHLSREELLNQLKEVAKKRRFKIFLKDDAIIMRSGFSAFSHGEVTTVDFKHFIEDQRVDISSKQRWPFSLIGSPKLTENVKYIEQLLK